MNGGTPVLYDFRSPSRFSREQVRALQMVNETFARQMATVLSTTLRIVGHSALNTVEQVTYDNYSSNLPNPSLLAVVEFTPMGGDGVFQMPMNVVMSIIDRLLGGPGTDEQPSRALSDIEAGLIRNLVQRIVRELTYAFDTLAPVKATVQSLESDVQLLQLAPPQDPMVVSDFEIRIGDLVSSATLCMPVSTVAPVLDVLKAKPQELTGPQAAAAKALNERMHEVPVVVTVAFEPIQLTSSEVLDLQVGDVLPLRHPTNQPLTLSADGVPVGTAVPGSHGSRLACQIIAV
ncbi:flagellar motor switch protein FliM [Austwickia chelonae]|uniref:Flagellar motor switch protein FliM n=1 Tax=Austwickia chelonae NBRC 105200 TaxID=1184607 RepID=K6V6A9_9MICO|nr:flagellar motor switch protein FliM [Austwickia chelonae]GAB77768.1 flagellar motor switch protein FliM [Austwickia chelonae NBRC 105200]SEV89111.1 flagellar motor switch protein FliM [Austwickia chelonae]